MSYVASDTNVENEPASSTQTSVIQNSTIIVVSDPINVSPESEVNMGPGILQDLEEDPNKELKEDPRVPQLDDDTAEENNEEHVKD